MKTTLLRIILTLAAMSITVPLLAQNDGNYTVTWFTIDGGGGNSTGGVYSVSGTLGQPDAGQQPMSGGNYTLQGGFWPGLIVPSTTGTPTLFIRFSSGNVIISWSPATPGFVLEETTSLTTPSWSPASAGNPTAPIPAIGQPRFYRLRKP